MTERLTLVTAMVYDKDGDCSSATVCCHDGELANSKEEALGQAKEFYADNIGGNLPLNVVYTIISGPVPKHVSATVTADVEFDSQLSFDLEGKIECP